MKKIHILLFTLLYIFQIILFYNLIIVNNRELFSIQTIKMDENYNEKSAKLVLEGAMKSLKSSGSKILFVAECNLCEPKTVSIYYKK